METNELQKMSVYFPLDLLENVRESAKNHRRSFNKEVLYLVERGMEEDAVRRTHGDTQK